MHDKSDEFRIQYEQAGNITIIETDPHHRTCSSNGEQYIKAQQKFSNLRDKIGDLYDSFLYIHSFTHHEATFQAQINTIQKLCKQHNKSEKECTSSYISKYQFIKTQKYLKEKFKNIIKLVLNKKISGFCEHAEIDIKIIRDAIN